MKKQLTHILKGAASLMAVLVLIFYFQTSLYFKHSHHLADGSIIEHSHPFSDSSGEQHKHSENEIYFLSLLNPSIDLVHGFPNLIIETTDLFIVSVVLMDETIQLMKLPLMPLRGPPSSTKDTSEFAFLYS